MGSDCVVVLAPRLDGEMTAFLDWFNTTADIDPVLKAGLAHLWFVTIHPFDDGNGRIARAIADMALARSENSTQRFYSMSAQIHQERDAYYEILEQTQKGTMIITPWMEWFLGCLGRAVDGKVAGDNSALWRTSMTNRSDFRAIMKRWASGSVKGLNELKAQSPINDQGARQS